MTARALFALRYFAILGNMTNFAYFANFGYWTILTILTILAILTIFDLLSAIVAYLYVILDYSVLAFLTSFKYFRLLIPTIGYLHRK